MQQEHAVVDRFEGSSAVLIVGEERRPFEVARDRLPEGTREGAWLLVMLDEGAIAAIEADLAATAAARQRIEAKLARLRRGDHLADKSSSEATN